MLQTKSSWTPLSNKGANKKLFEERKSLVLSWFTKWSESQRELVLISLLNLCSQRQLESLSHYVEDRIPVYQVDFTRTLPRVLCIYIFSFLDPRSLCRCAQVCWYWRYLAESNELWATKCIKHGWDLIASQSHWEPGIWKKHYIQNIRYLQLHSISKSSSKGDIVEKCSEKLISKQSELVNLLYNHIDGCVNDKNTPEDGNIDNQKKNESFSRYEKFNLKKKQISFDPLSDKDRIEYLNREITMNGKNNMEPWRVPSRKPTETHRLNYFDNDVGVIKVSGNESRNKRSSSAGSKRYSRTFISNTYNTHKSTEVTSNIGDNYRISQPHDKKQSETTLESTNQSSLLLTRRYSFALTPWKPTSPHPSRSYRIGVKEERHQYDSFKKYIHHNIIQERSGKIGKISGSEPEVINLHMNNSKASEANKSSVWSDENKGQKQENSENQRMDIACSGDKPVASSRSSIPSSSNVITDKTPPEVKQSGTDNLISNDREGDRNLLNFSSSPPISMPSKESTTPLVDYYSSFQLDNDIQKYTQLSSLSSSLQPTGTSLLEMKKTLSPEPKPRKLNCLSNHYSEDLIPRILVLSTPDNNNSNSNNSNNNNENKTLVYITKENNRINVQGERDDYHQLDF
ncbi:unnamed protein product [Heterobilharzia americana]|nr:unnamed protein product [Heterobilharzia americana]CAH8632502.1 unnamed protein product [Heterobilharzia americana]